MKKYKWVTEAGLHHYTSLDIGEPEWTPILAVWVPEHIDHKAKQRFPGEIKTLLVQGESEHA